MSTSVLHYIYDPLCGWCYGASPLIQAARDILPVRAHGGGMMTGAQRRKVTSDLRQYVMAHDQRIAQLSGQPFGPGYFDGLLRDQGAVFDSAPPITAVLAAEQSAGAALDMLARLQRAHYVEGRRIAETDVILEMARDVGLGPDAFGRAFRALEGPATQAHIEESRALLSRVGGSGFPTFALEVSGRFTVVDIQPYLGNPLAWRSWLAQQVAGHATGSPVSNGLVCSPDSCVS